MKITLEKEDIATLLGKAMGYAIGADDLEVNTDPFEVVIRNVRKAELAAAATKEVAPAHQPNAEVSQKPFDTTAPAMPDDEAEEAIVGLHDINAGLTATGGGAGPVPESEAPMFRSADNLGPSESYDPNFNDKGGNNE